MSTSSAEGNDTKQELNSSVERCDKCHVVDEDCRTLWMSCFYAMEEMPIPFTRRMIRGQIHELVRLDKQDWPVDVPVWRAMGDPVDHTGDTGNSSNSSSMNNTKDEPLDTPTSYPFYTLRVCKDCRADWLFHIRSWYKTPKDQPCAEQVQEIQQEAACVKNHFSFL